MSKLLVTGDSISACEYVTATENYGFLLKEKLGHTELVNTAVPGYTADDILSNIQSLILSKAAQQVIIMVGTNEIAASSTNNTSALEMVEHYISVMSNIIQQVTSTGANLIIFSPPLSKNIVDWQRAVHLTGRLKELCYTKKILFVDIFSAFLNASKTMKLNDFLSYYHPDFWHLTAAGHKFIADTVTTNIIGTSTVNNTWSDVVYNAPLNVGFSHFFGKTNRTYIPLSALTIPSYSVNRVKLTLQGPPSEGLYLTSLYLGSATSTTNAASFFPVTINNGTQKILLNANQSLETDWINFNWDKSSPLLLSMYAGEDSGKSLIWAKANPAAYSSQISGNNASNTNISTTAIYSGYLCLVSKIQMSN